MSQCCKINKIVLFYIIEALVFDFKPYVIELKIQNKFGHFWCENCHEATLYSERYCFLFAKKKGKAKKNFPKNDKKVFTWNPDQNLDKGQDADDSLLQLRPQPQLD